MELPKRGPSRAEWTEFSEEIQNDVNNILEILAPHIDLLNAELTDLHRDNREKFNERVPEIITSLDRQWGYLQDVFMITGKWHVPTDMSVGSDGIEIKSAKTDAFVVARSNGFMIGTVDVEGEKQPRVGLSFTVREQAVSSPMFQGHIELLAFAEPHEISLQFLRPASNEVVSCSAEEVAHAIAVGDAVLDAYLNHSATTFFNQSGKKQAEFFRSVIDMVENVMPTPGSMDHLRLVQAKTSALYIRVPGESDLTPIHKTDDGPPLELTGDILGVTLLDTLIHEYGKKYSSKDETATSIAGLCAIVRPRVTNFNMQQFGSVDLIVPLRFVEDPEIKVV